MLTATKIKHCRLRDHVCFSRERSCHEFAVTTLVILASYHAPAIICARESTPPDGCRHRTTIRWLAGSLRAPWPPRRNSRGHSQNIIFSELLTTNWQFQQTVVLGFQLLLGNFHRSSAFQRCFVWTAVKSEIYTEMRCSDFAELSIKPCRRFGGISIHNTNK